MCVSIIMATIGRTDDVGRMICSLKDQTDQNFELIIVDQNTDNRLFPHIAKGREMGLDIQHVRLNKPSLSGARNLGVSLAQFGIIAFPDDDCWYDCKTIESILTAFANDSSIDGVIATWVEQAGGDIPEPHILAFKDWRCFRGGNASSISLFLSRKLFIELGGFDDRFGVGCWYGAGEETDLVLRALAGGARLYYNPDAKVFHHFSNQFHGNWKDAFTNVRYRSRGTGALYAKHRLGGKVIIRGFIAPVLVPIVKLSPLLIGVEGIAKIFGRVEGYLHWRFTGK